MTCHALRRSDAARGLHGCASGINLSASHVPGSGWNHQRHLQIQIRVLKQTSPVTEPNRRKTGKWGEADHFTAPKVRPRTSCFWQNQPSTTIGPTAAVDTADKRPKNSPSGARFPSISLDRVAASVVVRRTVQ